MGFFWLAEQSAVQGWEFKEIPLSESAEKLLVADRLVNGEFSQADRAAIRVFSAKRYTETQNEIGLFVHTPDRCWTETGWKMEVTEPDSRQIRLHGIPLALERRIFHHNGNRELVYFGGLVGGQPLPYRLDHNLSVGMKHALRTARDQTGTSLRASDERFWGRVFDSFVARRPLMGPKQFIRISTPMASDDGGQADALLTEFLSQWLQPVEYNAELRSWKLAQLHPNR
jgi:hypothetical protein